MPNYFDNEICRQMYYATPSMSQHLQATLYSINDGIIQMFLISIETTYIPTAKLIEIFKTMVLVITLALAALF